MPRNNYTFKGKQSDLKNYLIKDLKINPVHPTTRCTGRFQLTSLVEQIHGILNSSQKKGKIYYTEEYKINLHQDEDIENDVFEIYTVDVEIID